jgi:Dna[CI] antecedent DciA-like protein
VRAELARFGVQAGLAELVAGWPAAVGEAVARNAWPARIGRDGTVHVSARDSVWAFELAQRGGEIAGRLGVERVRFAPGPLPTHEPAGTREAAACPTPEDRKAAAAIAAPIEDENLRETVQKAVGFWLAKGLSDRPF